MAAWRLAALTSILCMAGFMRAEEPTLPQVKLQAPALPRSNASQSSAKSNSFAVPPLIMPGPFEAGGLPNAVEVSQPLQPVTNPPPSADAPREMFAWEELTAPFPYSWFSGEF